MAAKKLTAKEKEMCQEIADRTAEIVKESIKKQLEHQMRTITLSGKLKVKGDDLIY